MSTLISVYSPVECQKWDPHFDNIAADIFVVWQAFCLRFPDTEAMVKFGVLGLRPVHCLAATELQSWGNAEVESLAQFNGTVQLHSHEGEQYHSQPLIDATVDTVLEEWEVCKATVKTLKYEIASLANLWKVLARFHPDDFPNLTKLAQLAITHPVHSCDCERVFSVQNLTLTPPRNRLSPEYSNQLMRISIEGGKLEEFDFGHAVKLWRAKCQRKIFEK